ncbi:MAG: DUF21 domain-containing protein [Verrucomicrobia bacterium]|nr:DUF21 domain-containing protein [Verrucomicrobiota bacterium]
MHGVGYLLLLGLCLVVSFLMSGMEAGVFALSRVRLRRWKRAGEPQAGVLLDYLERPEDFLWTILVGNTVANFVAVSLVTLRLFESLGRHPAWFWAAFFVAVFWFYACCDLLPKMLFRQYPNRLCLRTAGMFRFVRVVLAPLVSLVAWLADGLLRWTGGKVFTGHLFGSRDELRQVMLESGQGLSTEERAMINRVLDLQNLTVRRITVPVEKVVTVNAGTPMSQVLQICRDQNLTRLPVWQADGERRRIGGILSLSTVLFAPDLDPGRTAGDYVKPALYLDEDVRLEEALRRMQRSGHHLGIVLARDRRELGVISLQDILGFIFGAVSW